MLLGVFRLAALLFFALLTIRLNAQVPVTRPKITGIAYVRFESDDVEKSRAFYEKILGLASGGNGCEGVSNPCFVINSWQHLELIQAQSGDQGSFLSEIALATTDVKQMHEYLYEHGVRSSQIARLPSGRLFFETEDPEHNRIAFVERTDESTSSSRKVQGAVHGTVRKQVGNQMLHVGFVAKDLEQMKKFYVDLLGFRLYWYGCFKDDGVDWYEIQVPDGNNWIEFMLNIPGTADRQELGVQNHFSLGVSDANAAAAMLRANGATQFDGPEIGRDGKNSLDIYDPDLTRVEVMELSPSKTPCCHPYSGSHPQQ